MTDDEVRALALLLLPYRQRVEAVWSRGARPTPTTTPGARLLTVPEAAERLACSRWHVYDLVKAGKLRRHYGGLKGNILRLSEQDVQAYIDSLEVPLPSKRRPPHKPSS